MIVERILTSRYLEIARFQRSCHSCHFDSDNLIPCGKCSKCQGVLLFLLANNVDPSTMGYQQEDAEALPARIALGALRLDEDERDHSLYLAKLSPNLKVSEHVHVETIHLHEQTSDMELVPARFRSPLINILTEHTKGFSTLKDDSWVPIKNSTSIP
jgi:hypothetical protein